MDDIGERLEALRRATTEGGSVAMEAFRTGLTVEEKAGPMDTVTEVDRAVQRTVAGVLAEAAPGHAVVAEEADARKRVPESGDAWIVDPIDGTNNYVAGNRNWAVSAAAVADGEVRAGVNNLPALGDVVAAGEGRTLRNGDAVSVSDRLDPGSFLVNPIFGLAPEDRSQLASVVDTVTREFGDLRRLGSAQAALSAVACGELEAAVSTVRLSAWDTAAGVHHVRHAGGEVTDIDGEPWRPGATGLVASNGRSHRRLLEAIDGR